MSYNMHSPWGGSDTKPSCPPSLTKVSGPVRSTSYSPAPSRFTARASPPERKASVRESSPSAPFYARRSRQTTEAEGGRSDGSDFDMAMAEYTYRRSHRRPYEEDVDELDDDDIHSEVYGTITPPVQYPPIPTTNGHLDIASELDGVRKTKKCIRGGGGTAHDVWHFFDKHTRSCGLCQKRGVNFSYGTKTTTGGMRYHLLLVHHEVYLEACERNGWKKHLPIMNRYDFERARQAAKNRDFQKSVEKSVADWVEAANLAPEVIDCPQFRALLRVLRPDLRDMDIPDKDAVKKELDRRLWVTLGPARGRHGPLAEESY